MDLKTLYQNTLENRGLSLNRLGDTHTGKSGFLVSIPQYEITLRNEDFTYQNFVECLLDLARSASENPTLGSKCLFGVWFDATTKIWYFDISEIIEDRDIALRLGKHRKQVAIWDCGHGVAVSV
jgi:hypothetical protein